MIHSNSVNIILTIQTKTTDNIYKDVIDSWREITLSCVTVNVKLLTLLNDREFWLILLIRDWPRRVFLDRTSE